MKHSSLQRVAKFAPYDIYSFTQAYLKTFYFVFRVNLLIQISKLDHFKANII
jgi:hypothetical protein